MYCFLTIKPRIRKLLALVSFQVLIDTKRYICNIFLNLHTNIGYLPSFLSYNDYTWTDYSRAGDLASLS